MAACAGDKSFIKTPAGKALFSGMTGGITAELTGGNFVKGFVQGATVAYLNHSFHKQWGQEVSKREYQKYTQKFYKNSAGYSTDESLIDKGKLPSLKNLKFWDVISNLQEDIYSIRGCFQVRNTYSGDYELAVGALGYTGAKNAVFFGIAELYVDGKLSQTVPLRLSTPMIYDKPDNFQGNFKPIGNANLNLPSGPGVVRVKFTFGYREYSNPYAAPAGSQPASMINLEYFIH